MCTSFCGVSFPGLQPRCAVRHCPIMIRSDTEHERRLRYPNLIPSGLFHLGGPGALERAKDAWRGLPVPSCDWSLKPRLIEESLCWKMMACDPGGKDRWEMNYLGEMEAVLRWGKEWAPWIRYNVLNTCWTSWKILAFPKSKSKAYISINTHRQAQLLMIICVAMHTYRT